LAARRERGESGSDLARVRAKSEAELEADIASDPDFRDEAGDWFAAAVALMPVGKQALSLRLDEDVVAWFRAQGPGYQTRINAVLPAFVARQVGGGGARRTR
jgi:uncharacterized protein (DUF4415 family)